MVLTLIEETFGYMTQGVIADDAQIDFKIQALIGYKTQVSRGSYAYPFGESCYCVFTGESSNWSNVQTVSIYLKERFLYRSCQLLRSHRLQPLRRTQQQRQSNQVLKAVFGLALTGSK